MRLPNQPVTLTVEQLTELRTNLAAMRHDINNNLSLIMAAVELLRQKPHLTERMLTTLTEQPSKITQSLVKFSEKFDSAIGLR
jgi:hypothetical protein